MPKELTHWHIARDVLQRGIPAQIGKIIAGNPALYYLGAIAHDIAFYDLSKPPEASIERVANQLHGVQGENTLVPLIMMIETALSRKNRHAMLAFLLGMLTHFVADSSFHPMVYYMSGNYFADDLGERGKAVFRHRLFETAVDLWLETNEPLDYPSDLIHLWREAGDHGQEAIELLVGQYAVDGDKRLMTRFKKAWLTHRFLQTAFRWTIPWRLLALYRRFGHPTAEKQEALFYPQPLNLNFFEAQLEWCHPVTGESYVMTVDKLLTVTVEKVQDLFEKLGEQNMEKWSNILNNIPPLSLDSGLPYVSVSEMKYFRAEPIEYLLRL